MNKNIITEEKNRILELHSKEKKILNEQVSDVKTNLQSLLDNGCIPSGQVVKMKSSTPLLQYAIKKESVKTPGTYVYFFIDNRFGYMDAQNKFSFGQGKWECNKRVQQQQQQNQQIDTSKKLQELKNEGYEEYKDVVLKTKINDPKFYKSINFNGVETNKLYQPIYKQNEVGKIENWPEGSEQQKILQQLKNQGLVINPSQADIAYGNLEEYTPNIPDGLFPNKLKVYRDITKPSKTATVTSQEDYTSSTVGSQDCEQTVQLYWDSYKRNLPSKGTKFDDLKNKVQSCVNQNMYRWKKIGGVAGIGGGKRHLDKILEVMTNKEMEYENTSNPGRQTPWALKPPPVSGR